MNWPNRKVKYETTLDKYFVWKKQTKTFWLIIFDTSEYNSTAYVQFLFKKISTKRSYVWRIRIGQKL